MSRSFYVDAAASGAANDGHRAAHWIAALLTAVPVLLAYNLPPSPTLINQCLAFGFWGGWVMALAPGRFSMRAWPLQAALLALVGGVLWSWGPGRLPASMALSSLALLWGAMLLAWAGTEVARQRNAVEIYVAFAAALLLAGLLSVVVALVQVFAPGWTDGALIAHSGLVGRAVGNLRQPNHLCTLLLWAVIAAVALLDLRRLPIGAAAAAVLALVFAVELSASRTGAVGLVLLAAWGLFSRRLSRPARWLLLATPLIYALSYGVMAAWGEFSQQSLGAAARLAGEATGIESPNTRSRIWGNALAMIAQQPWTGVGFGEFNLAWSLTAFAGRPTAFFDHTHNLVLQLAVELGLPLAGGVLALLLGALVLAWRRSRAAQGSAHAAASGAWMMVLMIGLHSQVEYPLWYAYFLLPTAFAWGFALGIPGQPAPSSLPVQPAAAGALAGAAMVLAAALALFDCISVVSIYAPGSSRAPLNLRIARGQQSPLFAYQGDYAAATSPQAGVDVPLAFARAPHFLMDARLMVAWARWLAEHGQVDAARWLAQRIREFRNADAQSLFAPCGELPSLLAPGTEVAPSSAASAAAPPDLSGLAQPGVSFACQRPQRAYTWREFLDAAAAASAPPVSAASPALPATQ